MYLFRLILLCIPLFGAVAVTAEVQRIDRGHQEATVEITVEEPEIVLALNTVLPVLVATDATIVDEVQGKPSATAVVNSGLPVCLALVFLVALIRLRA